MSNAQGGTPTGAFSAHLSWDILITGITYNASGGSNYTYTPPIRGRYLPLASYVVSGTWATSTSATMQLYGSDDNTNWVALGSALTASSGTTPQAGSITGGGFVFTYYQWQLTGGDSGTNLTITARFAQSSP